MALPRLLPLCGAALTLLLAGCMDMQIDVNGPDSGRTTIVQTLSAEIYGMIGSAPPGMGPAFCAGAGQLARNADNSVSCVEVREGSFAELEALDRPDSFDVTTTPDGAVRIAFRPRTVSAEIDRNIPAMARNMAIPMFEGQNLTIRIVGTELLETNMLPTADGRGAEAELSFIDLINNSAGIPAELFAVVRPGTAQ